MEPIILASKSPQRQDILKRLNIPFISIPSEADESVDLSLSPEKAVEQIALRKAEAVLRSPLKINTPWIISADTLIFSNGTPMGKPTDIDNARKMLQSHSNAAHTVITAICCYDENLQHIYWYLTTGEWQGAAGGYRIQGTAACFITKIEGSYSGIVGLPIYELYDILTEHGYSFT